MHDDGDIRMKESGWSYRISTIDGPTRCGQFESKNTRIPLPFLIDILPDRRTELVLPHSTVAGITFEREENETGSILTGHIKERMRKLGIKELTGTAGAFRNRLFMEFGEHSGQLELLTDPLSRILAGDPYSLSSLLVDIASEEGVHPPLYLPGTGSSEDLETMFYLGAEVFDTTRARNDGMEGLYYTAAGHLSEEDLEGLGGPGMLCSCRACTDARERKPVPRAISDHNVEAVSRRLRLSHHHLLKGTLRQHLMGTLSGKPELLTLVREMEKGRGWPLDLRTPTFRNIEEVPVTYRDDSNAPDMSLWRKRISGEFTPLGHKKVLLLLPCSRKKPYSSSRTHASIEKVLSRVKGWKTFCQRLVLTSPLGIVPMELEDLYPASHYDIPVTGEWFHEEKEAIREMTRAVMEKGSFEEVVCYHKEGGEIFDEAVLSGSLEEIPFLDIHREAERKGSSPETELINALEGHGKGDFGIDRRTNEILEVLKAVEFSLEIRVKPSSDLNIKRSRRGIFLRAGKKVLFDLKKGGPVPSVEAGMRYWPQREGKRAHIDDFTPKGTLFCQGINSTEGTIRPGDIVLIGHGESFRAVGRASIPGHMMGSKRRGEGIRTISHVR